MIDIAVENSILKFNDVINSPVIFDKSYSWNSGMNVEPAGNNRSVNIKM